jgi:hypothetical protein
MMNLIWFWITNNPLNADAYCIYIPELIQRGVYVVYDPPTVIVPDVIGMTESDADTTLQANFLVKGIVTYDKSGTIPAGHVMAQNPSAGTVVIPCDSVDLVISLGGGGGGGCTPPAADQLHPLSVGLRYRYNRLDGDVVTNWTVEREFVEKMTYNSIDYYLLCTANYDNDDLYEVGDFVRTTENAVYTYYPPEDNLEFQAASVGTKWTVYEPSDLYNYKVLEIVAIEEVTVPYGTFCAYKHRMYQCNDPEDLSKGFSPYLYEWIVPGVGIVKEEDNWARDGQTAPLHNEPNQLPAKLSFHKVLKLRI